MTRAIADGIDTIKIDPNADSCNNRREAYKAKGNRARVNGDYTEAEKRST
jgi:hypothetical protein